MSQFSSNRADALTPSMDHVHGRAVTLIDAGGTRHAATCRVLDWTGDWGTGANGEQTLESLDVEVPTSLMATPGRGWAIEIDEQRFGFDDVLQRDTHGKHLCRFRRVVRREAAGSDYRGGRA